MSRNLAIDIGTTTIALSVVDTDGGHSASDANSDCASAPDAASSAAADSFIIENPQRLYGSDVISRMNNATKRDLAGKMRTMVRAAIHDAVTANGIDWHSLSGIVVSANTLMTHLFFGLDVSGMSAAPFTPTELAPAVSDWDGVPVTSMPGISAFVGGDIVSGIYALDLMSGNAPALFADLGTNGELVLSIDGKIITASVAAGPAFEGGNLSIGMPALPGAIDRLTVKNGFCRIHTIEDALPPKGLCGSGLMEVVYELLQDAVIDTHGSYVSVLHREQGFPLYIQNASQKLTLTQEDIRAFQVAKAAVRAGIETLLETSGLSISDISQFCLAGSFGQHLNLQKASAIGLIPEPLAPCTALVGNTSLAGAIQLARQPDDYSMVREIAENAVSVSLADSAIFKDAYIRYMDL